MTADTDLIPHPVDLSPKLQRQHRWIACSILLLVALAITDSFLLPRKKITEILTDSYAPVTRGYRGSGYTSYILVTQTGREILVPERPYNKIVNDDAFLIEETGLFRKPAYIAWCESNGKCYRLAIGTFNSSYLLTLLLIAVSIWSILLLLKVVNPIKNKTRRLNYLACTTTVVLLALYLIY